VKSIKNTICAHVLNDKDLFSKNVPPLTFTNAESDKKIFDGKLVSLSQVDDVIKTVKRDTKTSSKVTSSTTKKQTEEDNQIVRAGISDLVGLNDLAILHDAAEHLFKTNPGKMIRSKIIMLLARTLTSSNSSKSSRKDKSKSKSSNSDIDHVIKKSLALAICTEMSHSASLLHDDVVDESAIRRGHPTCSATFGNKLAILAGDLLFSRALRHLTVEVCIDQVTANVSQVLEDLTKGEVVQMSPNGNASSDGFDRVKCNEILDQVLDRYWVKTYLKTASLFALTCKSVATIVINSKNNNHESETDLEFFAQCFGANFGLAFQLIDDLLDFVDSENTESASAAVAALGKPAGQDLKLGLATLPVILSAKRHPEELIPLILRNFSREGDVDTAMNIVVQKDSRQAFAEARVYIQKHLRNAIGCLLHFPQSVWRDELAETVAKYDGFMS
jgi:geranylgeranyl pyrophosphate synthase